MTFIEKLVVTAIIGILLSVIVFPFIGIHYETGRGHHTGYITAVQKQGVIFKTGRAYVKTDPQSSQEDIYCVADEAVVAQLEELSKKKEPVDISYLSWLSAGITTCAGENDVIYAVSAL